MDDRNKTKVIGTLKSSAAIAFSVALVSLLVCTFFLCIKLVEILMPLLLIVLSSTLCFLLERMPFTRGRKKLKILLQLIFAVLTGVLLSI